MTLKINLFLLVTLISQPFVHCSDDKSCYENGANKPRKCSPQFENIAYELKVEATSTCGSPPSQYCKQANAFRHDTSRSQICDICDSNDLFKAHSVDYLTDFNDPLKPTWWQSETMNEGIQYPNSVNLTFKFKKSFEITYVQIKFHSMLPESFSIFKKTNETADWIPYQYYSGRCDSMYDVPNGAVLKHENEAIALCTDEFTAIATSGDTVAFSTLEGRPSAYNFESSEELKEWVTATDIKIVLNRLNTFGDEFFNDPDVLSSYYYSISDISIGGRCKCNGHAESCSIKLGENFEDKLKCNCEHNTDGVDCERCLPFYNDVPWEPASFTNNFECQPCNCSGKSNKCFFDRDLYEKTGHGGHCVECEDNSVGVNCEYCKEGFVKDDNGACINCDCDPLGSTSLQCDPEGKCQCKAGVTGSKCDRCLDGFYDLGITGCQLCNCSSIGSLDEQSKCDPITGRCTCKINVEGHNCDRCKPGYFNLEKSDTSGCTKCFCFGHSAECTNSEDYFVNQIISDFTGGLEDWKGTNSVGETVNLELDSSINALFIMNNNNTDELWFVAPRRFLGDQRKSYNQYMSINLMFSKEKVKLARKDLVLENSNYGFKIFRQLIKNSTMMDDSTEYNIQLKESNNWIPTLTEYDFQRLLSNITSLIIRASFSHINNTYLRSFSLNTATSSNLSETKANWIEKCKCPNGYAGENCEKCSNGYRRETQNGNSFTRCVPCTCNNHSNICDQQSGKCDCIHHTTGDNCERCKEGYYGNSLNGNSNDCKKCPCLKDGPCVEILNYHNGLVDIVCLNCPEGTQGNLCESCEDGYYTNTDTKTCEKCFCNDNIDENAILNCDSSDGTCLKCIYNTTGNHCEKCLDNYWGNPLTEEKCQACNCNQLGTFNETLHCNQSTGQCECKANVIGKKCNECEETYWNILSSTGCEKCNCDPLGSFNLSCDTTTGQCFCKHGVTGAKCDQCLSNYYQFSDDGCKPCSCDPSGSESMQCNVFGECLCKSNTVGVKCDKCIENFYEFRSGCPKCDDCYDLVAKKIKTINENIFNLKIMLDGSQVFESVEMKTRMNNVTSLIDTLHKDYYGLTISSFDEFLNYYSDQMKNISSELKKLNYEAKKEQLDYLNLVDGYLDNLVLELHAIELNIEEKSIMLSSSDNENIFKTSSQNMSDLSSLVRHNLEIKESIILELESHVENEIKNFETIINKVSSRQAELESVKIAKLSENIDVEHHVAIGSEIRTALKEDTEHYKNLLSKLEENKYDLNVQVDLISKFENNNKEIVKKSEDLKTEITEINKNVDAINGTLNSTKLAKATLELAKIKEKEYKDLHDISKTSKETAEKSFNILNTIYENMTVILDTLKNFDEKINKSRNNVNEASLNEMKIEINTEKTTKLYNSIVNELRNFFKEIEEMQIDEVFFKKQINKIYEVLEMFKATYENSSLDSNLLFEKFDNLMSQVEILEKVQIYHSTKLEMFQQNSTQLLKQSQQLYDNVNDELESLNEFKESDYTHILITNEELIDLDDKLATFTQNFNNLKPLSFLEERNVKISQQMDDLEKVILILEAEVNNLNQIKNTIKSEDCYIDKNIEFK